MFRTILLIRNRFSYLRTVDPYYILGLDKRAEFSEVKKKFYEYANIYHPDKNSSPEASQEFLLLKDAFQQIKAERGMSISQNIYKSDSSFASEDSVRPNAQQYTQHNQQAHPNFTSGADYKLNTQKIPQGQLYDKFRQSFSTIDNINDIKIKVERGEIKDNMKRLNLQQFRMKIKLLSEGGIGSFTIIICALAVFFLTANKWMNSRQNFKHMEAASMLRTEQANFIRGNDQYSQREVKYLRRDDDYARFKRQHENKATEIKVFSGSQVVFDPKNKQTWK